ncbi:hypothetical protein J6590_077918 [Homalodisca vitripennis]|nr:hypothetical protein J6590_077918 [Homalodisca vitripennis]
MGDFNINAMALIILPPNDLSTYLLRSFDLELLVKTPTRMTHSTKSTIDITSNLPSVAVSVVNTAISDHYGQEAIIRGVKIERELEITKTIRELRQGNIAFLNTSLSKENWKYQESIHSVEEHFKTITDTLNFHLNMYCPLKTIQVCTKRDEVEVANRQILRICCLWQGPCPSPPQGIPRRRQCPVASLALAPVVEEELEKIIQQLPAKNQMI